jgi:hypothetical protein
MSGFVQWVRRRIRGQPISPSAQEEPFDEETSGLIDGSVHLLQHM